MTAHRLPIVLAALVAAMAVASATMAAADTAGAAAAQTDAAAPSPAFDVLEYRVVGNSTLEVRDIERTVYPFLGPGRSMKDVEGARVALEALYHDRGYNTVFVDIPEQNVDDGVVRLHVAEGKLRRVAVTGARYFAGRDIKAALPAAQVDSVPHLPSLQTELKDLNTQTPDRTVVPVLRAGPVPGTVDLTLKVDDKLPLHASVEVNNQRTADTEPLRVLASLSYDNLFSRLDSLSLQYQTAPQDRSQVDVLAAGYTRRLGASGANLAMVYIDSKSDVATVGTLGVLGKGKIYGLHFTQPLAAESTGSAAFSAGLDLKQFAQSIVVDPNSTVQTPISYVNWSTGFSMSHSGAHQWTFNSTANFGMRGVRNDVNEFANKRFLARPNYFYLRSDASYLVPLPAKFTMLLRAAGQYSVEPLISNEEFAIGGADSVRGYLEAEELGDIGVHSTVQFGSPNLPLLAERLQFTAFVFFDGARVSAIDPLPGEPSNVALRSWGAGFNFAAPWGFAGSLTWADPLLDASHTLRGDSRLLFMVRASW